MRPASVRCALLCFLIVGLAGCYVDASLERRLQEAESQWRAQEIYSYQIEVAHGHSTWHYQIHTIVVSNGQVIDASATCVTAPVEAAIGGECEVEPYDPKAYTVPGLFATANTLAEAHGPEGLEIEFHESYGFPTRITFDLPNLIDEDQVWRVKVFEAEE